MSSSGRSTPRVGESTYTVAAAKTLFKVCSSKGSERKCVVAATYSDLLSVIKQKFQLIIEFRLVLEDDGAEIDDDCFPYLPQFTKLKFLPLAERYADEDDDDVVEVKVEPKVHELIDIADEEDDVEKGDRLFTLIVKTLTGRAIPVLVMSSDSIEMLKEKIQVKEGVPERQQRLIFRGQEVQNGRTISDYKVKKDDTVHLVLRLPMQILVKNQIGQVIPVCVVSADTVAMLKEQIRDEWGVAPHLQELFCHGEKLRDNRTISQYRISDQTTVHLVQRDAFIVARNRSFSGDKFQIFVKNLSGKTITIMISSSDTVEQLKEEIRVKEGIPPEFMRLIHAGKQLQDGRTLAQYRIEARSTVNMVSRLLSCISCADCEHRA